MSLEGLLSPLALRVIQIHTGYSTLCTRPDCALHGGSAKVGQDPTQKLKTCSA